MGIGPPLVRRQLTPGLISSLPGTAGLPPFIFFSTNYPDLDSAVLRHRDNERFVGDPEIEIPELVTSEWTVSAQNRGQVRDQVLQADLSGVGSRSRDYLAEA